METGRIAYETTLSQRAHSLRNSVRASQRQVSHLKKKPDRPLPYRQARMAALDEAQPHSEAAPRKKREPAILAAQEIANLPHPWDNTVVAVEDLDWISNTTQNGRRNQGAPVQRPTHYASQNDGLGSGREPRQHATHNAACAALKPRTLRIRTRPAPEHEAMDRDANAAVNIAARAASRAAKARVTRAKNRTLRPQAPLKTPAARNPLKHPGRDRTKNKPTPRRKNHRLVSREATLPARPARAQAHGLPTMILAGRGACDAPRASSAALKQGNATRKYRLRSPIWCRARNHATRQ